ncbi:MAG: hypothetical protein WC755_08315 [Candidatus Woesearchaeota archaeon]|jgi:hypothetical protein
MKVGDLAKFSINYNLVCEDLNDLRLIAVKNNRTTDPNRRYPNDNWHFSSDKNEINIKTLKEHWETPGFCKDKITILEPNMIFQICKKYHLQPDHNILNNFCRIMTAKEIGWVVIPYYLKPFLQNGIHVI